MPTPAVRTTVVVVTWRGVGHVGDCLDALAGQERAHRVLVVDNASTDGTAGVLAAHPTRPAVLRLPRNTGYAGGIAVGCAQTDTPLIAWLNDDAQPDPGWLGALEHALDDDVAAVASRMHHADGAMQSAGVALTTDGHGKDSTAAAAEPFAFCGGAALVRATALEAVGGLPERFFCYYEDTDTSWRLRLAGWRIVLAERATVRHLHGVSTAPGSATFHGWNERNRLLMLLRCAPARIALRELARFAVLTLILPTRRGRPRTPNFRFGLRCRVLTETLIALPHTLRARRDIGSRSSLRRGQVWQRWAVN